MENTITINVSDTFHELREHGDTAFPFAAYSTTGDSHDIPWHWHEEYEISFISKGRLLYRAGDKNLILKEGDGLFINSGTLHAQPAAQTSEAFRKDDIVFHGRLIYGSRYTVFWEKYVRPIASSGAFMPYIHFHGDVKWQKEIIDLIQKVIELSHKRPYGYEFYVRETLSQIFLLLGRNKKELMPETPGENFQEMLHVKKILGFIQNNYSEEITLKDLASGASICEREVQRAFQNVIHQSPIQYLIQYRIGKACQMLDTGEQSIIEICNSCGFSSPSYFSKTFKKIVGCTPTEYRNTR